MKTRTFISIKGGTGKTSSVATIGHILAGQGFKTLLVDNDPQANLTSLFFNSNEETEEVERNFNNLLLGQDKVSDDTIVSLYEKTDVDIRKYISKTKYENLDIIKADITLAKGEDFLKAHPIGQLERLNTHLKKIENEYDYCLIDCSPNLGILNINAVMCCEKVFIPARTDEGSLNGIAQTIGELINPLKAYKIDLKLGGIFFTAYNEREKVSKAIIKILKDNPYTNQYLLDTNISNSTLVKRIGLEKKMLLEMKDAQNRNVLNEYLNLVEYIK